MKILVLGKNGMLGHVVYNHFSEQGYEVIGTTVKADGINYDAYNDMEKLESIVKNESPDYVINCVGILNQVAEDNKPLAVKLNSLLPHYIDELSKKENFKFIHVSTDCVFEGDRGYYDETINPDATSFYGRSKALGEVINDRNTTLRTSIVGPDNNPKGIGLFQWFMNQENQVGGYTKVFWTGVTTVQLATVMQEVIEKNITGFHHVVNNEEISKHDLLVLFKEKFNKNIDILENDKVESRKTLVRTDKSHDFKIPSYEQMVSNMKEWVDEHQDIYPTNEKVR